MSSNAFTFKILGLTSNVRSDSSKYALLRQSSITRLPHFMNLNSTSYRLSFIKMSCRRFAAWLSGFFNMASSDLWFGQKASTRPLFRFEPSFVHLVLKLSTRILLAFRPEVILSPYHLCYCLPGSLLVCLD